MRSWYGALGLLLAVTLSLGACGSPGAKKDDSGAAGTGGGSGEGGSSNNDGGVRDGRTQRDTTGAAGTGSVEPDAGEHTDGVSDGDAFFPTVPPSICPEDDGGVLPDAGTTDVAPEPDKVVFLPNVTVSTLVGMAMSGAMNGPAAVATFRNPVSVAFDPVTGDLVVCDFDNDMIRRVADPTGTPVVSTLTMQSGFQRPFGIAVDPSGNVYFDTDFNSSGGKNTVTGTIWKVDTVTGKATPVAENLGRPRGLAALADGRLVLGDYQNQRVRLLNPMTGEVTDLAGLYGCEGMVDGKGKDARFGIPYGVTVLPDGKVIVADETNHRLRQVTPDGTVTTFAGDGGDGTVDGPRLKARFSHPTALTADFLGNIFVTDHAARRIRRVALDGTVTTVAGDGTEGFMDGPGEMARFYGIEGIAASKDGKTLYVADGTFGEIPVKDLYNRIRVIKIGP